MTAPFPFLFSNLIPKRKVKRRGKPRNERSTGRNLITISCTSVGRVKGKRRSHLNIGLPEVNYLLVFFFFVFF